jgi:hypothetical protein
MSDLRSGADGLPADELPALFRVRFRVFTVSP